MSQPLYPRNTDLYSSMRVCVVQCVSGVCLCVWVFVFVFYADATHSPAACVCCSLSRLSYVVQRERCSPL